MAYRLYWTSADRQASIPMGEYPTAHAAEAAVPDALREMLGQCARTDPEHTEQCSEIEVGTWTWEPIEGAK